MKLGSSFLAPGVAFLAAIVACGGSGGGPTPAPATPGAAAAAAQPALSGKITVFAAASLADAFNELGTAFKAANPGTNVAFQFAGSSVLRTQLEQGARADIFASADTVQMGTAATNGAVADTGKVFVHNTPTIIVPIKNGANINTAADLAKPGTRLVLAQASVPIGNYARRVLGNMAKDPANGADFSDRVLKNLVSEESDVKQVVAKVQLGEADAGVVYTTDITAPVAPQLKVIAFPAAANVIADYPIALTKAPGNRAVAQGFISFVLSDAGQAILKKYGFATVIG